MKESAKGRFFENIYIIYDGKLTSWKSICLRGQEGILVFQVIFLGTSILLWLSLLESGWNLVDPVPAKIASSRRLHLVRQWWGSKLARGKLPTRHLRSTGTWWAWPSGLIDEMQGPSKASVTTIFTRPKSVIVTVLIGWSLELLEHDSRLSWHKF